MKIATWLLAALAGVVAPAAVAAEFPTKPISLVVGYAPGGGTDIFARIVGEEMGKQLGQSVIIENKPGANASLAAEGVANAAPDGHTLIFVVNSHVTNPGVIKGLSFDPIDDFKAVGMAVTTPLLLVANPALEADNAKELIELARSRPGQISFASPGIGSPAHLTIEMLKSMAGVDILVVHYKGAGPAQTDVIAGHAHLQIPTIAQALPNVTEGKIKIIAQPSLQRSPLVPDIGTIAEAGIEGFHSDIWFAVLAPKGTPDDVIAKLNGALNAALASPDIVARLTEMGATAASGTPEAAMQVMRDDQKKWLVVMKDVGIEPQ